MVFKISVYVNNGHVISIRGVMDPVSLERRSLLSSAPISNGQQNKKRIFKNYWKELKACSLNTPSILLLIYASSIPVCYMVSSDIANYITTPLDSSGSESDESLPAYGLRNALYLLIPFFGWLSDAKISHGRAIYLSLWLGWIATLLCSIGYCLQYSSYGIIALIGRYAFLGIALIFLVPSMAFMFTNILPYGIDQMMNVSSVKIRAFIHWFVWEYLLCINVFGYFLITEYQTGALIIAVAGFALFSLFLCLHFHLQHRFEHIPIPNPYKIVFKVLKYSIQNNHNRRQRSAFTYWGKEPSRIDLAKERYGGSFTHEEVENVKTLLRIAAVLIALIPFWIVTDPYMNTTLLTVAQFKDGHKGLRDHASYIIWFIGYGVLFVLIPLLELVILPLFPNLEYFLINPLRGLGLANILIILSILSVFLIDVIGRAPYDKIHCFNVQANNNHTIQVSYWILVIPSLLSGTSYFIAFMCIFEFLCSQTPFGMHAMIIGFFWLVHSVGIDIGLGIKLLFRYFTFSTSSVLSCTSWYTIMLCLVGLVGLVVYVLTARWYVKRIRDTDLDLHTEIEQRWEQRLIRDHSYVNSINDLTISNTSVN